MLRAFHRVGEVAVTLGPPAAKYDWYSVTWVDHVVSGILFGQTQCSAEGVIPNRQSYEMELYVDGVRIANTGLRQSVENSAGENFAQLHCFGAVKVKPGSILLMKIEVVNNEALIYAHKTDMCVIW